MTHSWPCWVWLVSSPWAETSTGTLGSVVLPRAFSDVFLCLFFQAETLLTAVVTPLLKEKYGRDSSFTHIWNVTMEEVR